ncbi:MAG: hypothetical protein R3F59_26315 [Myxococcota bacterium]
MDLTLPEPTLEDVPHWVDHATLPAGGADVVLDSGLVWPVTGADGEVLGLVFVGTGELGWRWQAEGEALSALGRLASDGDLPADAARRALEARRSTATFDALVVLGRDPAWGERLAAWPAVTVHGRSLSWTDPTGLEQLVVLDNDLPGYGAARRQLNQRLRALAKADLDPLDMLAADALRPGVPRTVLEAHPVDAWRRAAPWLARVRDPTGAVDDAYGEVLAAHDVRDWAPLTGVPRSEPLARARVEQGTVRAAVSLEEQGAVVAIDVVAELTVTAAAPTPFVELALPQRPDPLAHYAVPRVDDEPVTLVGPPGAALVGAPWGRWDGDDVRLRIRLPEPLGPDAPATVTVRWVVRRPAEGVVEGQQLAVDTLPGCEQPMGLDERFEAYVQRCPASEVPGRLALGAVTVGHALVPRALGQRERFPATLAASAALPEDWVVVVGGADSERRLSVGRGALEVREGGGLPTLRVLSRDGGVDPAPLVAEVVGLYQRVLPTYPGAELTVVQGPDLPLFRVAPPVTSSKDFVVGSVDGEASPKDPDPAPTAVDRPGVPEVPPEVDAEADGEAARPSVWRASGLVEVRGVLSLEAGMHAGGRIDRRLLERDLAGAIAADWWTELPWTRREAWLGRALPYVYRDLYASWRWSRAQAATWRDTLPGGPDEQAGRLLGQALADRVGEVELLEALDRFRRLGPYTVAGLQAAVEAVTAEDLSGFFAPWLAASRGVMPVPKLKGTAHADADGVMVRVTSDFPLGRLDVPLGLCRRKRCAVVWVTLVDGVADQRVAHAGRVDHVVIDPEAWLPLTARRVRLGEL